MSEGSISNKNDLMLPFREDSIGVNPKDSIQNFDNLTKSPRETLELFINIFRIFFFIPSKK